MYIDLSLPLTPELLASLPAHTPRALAGHLGTHFDIEDQEFPLEYTERAGVVFDVRAVAGRDIGIGDVDLSRVEAGMFVAFCTGFLEEAGYGTERYRKAHPQLSDALLDALLARGVSIIGVDCAGVRRGKEHGPADRRCAARGTFIVENLCGLAALLSTTGRLTIHTYPLRLTGLTGLPCRVVARVRTF